MLIVNILILTAYVINAINRIMCMLCKPDIPDSFHLIGNTCLTEVINTYA